MKDSRRAFLKKVSSIGAAAVITPKVLQSEPVPEPPFIPPKEPCVKEIADRIDEYCRNRVYGVPGWKSELVARLHSLNGHKLECVTYHKLLPGPAIIGFERQPNNDMAIEFEQSFEINETCEITGVKVTGPDWPFQDGVVVRFMEDWESPIHVNPGYYVHVGNVILRSP